MSDDMREEISETRNKVKAAHAAIQALCNGERFLMSIPANRKTDHDLILSDALLALDADLEKAEAANRDKDAEIARLTVEAENIEGILRAYDYKGDTRDKLLWLESDMLTAQRKQKMLEAQLASLRAGEKWVVFNEGVEAAAVIVEKVWPKMESISARIREEKLPAPPSTDKES